MADNKTIHYIPPLPPKREKRVGIYCRVSTNSADQLKSLTAQVSALTRLTAANPKWLLVDVYIDGKTITMIHLQTADKRLKLGVLERVA